MPRPIIGITPDTASPNDAERSSPRERFRYESPATYSRAVVAAGGVPVILPYHVEAIADYLQLCDGFILSGGDDPDTTPFGEAVHPAAKLLHPLRQQFELALLAALDATVHPVLGICLGMQLMALHAGGRLHQHLPDAPNLTADQAAMHRGHDHAIVPTPGHVHLPAAGRVYSHHHQAVADAGRLSVAAVSDEASGRLIEAIELSDARRFYLGVQWHPERTADASLGPALIGRFVAASHR